MRKISSRDSIASALTERIVSGFHYGQVLAMKLLARVKRLFGATSRRSAWSKSCRRIFFEPLEARRLLATDLASKINPLIADESLAARLGSAGRKRVVDHFSWAAIAEQTAALYRTASTANQTT